MGSKLSQKNALNLEVDPAIAQTQEPQRSNQTVEDHHSDKMDARDRVSQSRKRQRARSGEAGPDLFEIGTAAAFDEQTQGSEEKLEGLKRKRHVGDEIEGHPKEKSDAELIKASTKELWPQNKEKTQAVSEEGQALGTKRQAVLTSKEAKRASASHPSPSYLASSVDMVFPEDEVPIELCPFSSDESVEETQFKLPPRRTNSYMNTAYKTFTACTTPSAAALKIKGKSSNTAQKPELVTAKESAYLVTRSMGKRKRRKKLSYSAPRNKFATKPKHEKIKVPVSLALEKLTIVANGYAADHEVDADFNNNASVSPIYPDADASHLYPSTFKGESWQWQDADVYFDPLVQGDLDNLARWRKENADFVSASSSAWCGVPGMERGRAVLELILTDASNMVMPHMDILIRRGRHYRDVWEEADFLAQQRRKTKLEEIPDKGQVITMKMKHRGFTHSTSSLLESHRNLVYGYDDDLFDDFRCRLEDRVKLYQIVRRQEDATAKVDEQHGSDMSADEIVFDDEVLPTYPICQLHPASLGLWKLRKNQEPDFSVVHPGSLNRDQVPTRCKEEMRRHHQRQHQLYLLRSDQAADLSDEDDEGNGKAAHELCDTILNSEVTENLPSFGNEVETDEISKMLAASIRKLVPLSIQNWRILQRVHDRATCSIQCEPLLEGEAAAARELENLFLQLCPPADSNTEIIVPNFGIGPTLQLRTQQIISAPHDLISYSVRHDIADNCSLAVAASVEYALRLRVGDVVDVLDRNGCWNYGEVVETYSEDKQRIAKFLLLRFSLWSEDTVEWIAASEGRILPHGIATGLQSCSVGPTRAHRVCIRYDQCLARELERSFPQRQAKQATATFLVVAQRPNNVGVRSLGDQQKTPQKRRRK